MQHNFLTRLLLTLTLLLGFSPAVWADDIPYRQQRREIFRQLPVKENSIVFLGNSITDFGLWSEFFGNDSRIVNRGIQGIESPEVLEHLALIGSGHPAKVFLMIGINDFNTPERVVPNIRKMVETLRTESPATTVYVQSILPCNLAQRANVPPTLNPQIKTLCQELGVTYIDVYSEMTKISGNTSMPAEMTDDSLHPNAFGYRTWCKVLEPHVGITSSIDAAATPQTVKKPLSRAIYKSLLTEYEMVPATDGEVLHIGDYQVMTGEWAELMGTPAFRNRGLGGGYGWSMSLDEFNSAADCFIKGSPSKIFFQCGKRALDDAGANVDALFTKYEAAIANIQRLAPNADIYLESIIPNASVAINTANIIPFNAKIRAKAEESSTDRLHFVDVYSALAEDGVLAPRYQGANTEQSRGINGRGYVRWAQTLAPFVPGAKPVAEMTDAQAELNELVWDALNVAWTQPDKAARTTLRNKISEAQALLAEGNASDAACAMAASALREQKKEALNPTMEYPAGSGLNNLMPRPQQVKLGSGTYSGAIADAKVEKISADALAALGVEDYKVEGFDNEGYQLIITTSGITIKAATDLGVIRAKQTLAQMEQDGTFECCEIVDWPAFKVRGFMHDVGRSYISYEELKKEIDLLSRFKVNMFHWHLTDYHAFRFESKLHPEVNTKAFERFVGQYYSQAQCKELDAYARERGVVIIPEIDMPGHSRQFKNATGYDMNSTEGQRILKDILGEVAECFPNAPYIHVGADETSVTQQYVKEMTDYIHTKGKKTVCWQTYGGGTVNPTNMGIDMLTNWATSGRLVNGVPNIDMRYFYVNHFDVFADLEGAYRSLIFDAEKGNPNIGGVSIGIWNDRYLSDEKQIVAQNNVYAAALAMSERAWCGGAYKDNHHQYIEKGRAYLPNEGWEYEEFADWERRFLIYKNSWLKDEPIPYVKQTNIRWNITQGYANSGDKTRSFAPETADELKVEAGSTFATGAGVWLNHIWAGTVNGVFPTKQDPGQTRYAWTYVYSPVAQKVGAQIEFYNYSRSDGGNVPEAGKWDRMGSRVWVNDKEVLPTWTWSQGTSEESDLGNLNFPGRKPVQVDLQQGWNKVLLKVPYVGAGLKRGNKWQYTFVFTDTEGKNAVEGLVYSPSKNIDGIEDFRVPSVARVEPTVSTADETHWYTIKSLRGSYNVKSAGLGVNMTREAAASEAAYWKFKRRSDNTYNIINYSDGGYLSPAPVDGKLQCVKAEPANGWTLGEAATDGYFIVKCDANNTQLHNDKSGNVLNWGYGTQTAGQYRADDDGCQFIFTEIQGLNQPTTPDAPTSQRYTIRLVDTEFYFTTNEVNDNTNKTYSISIEPEVFVVNKVNGGYTIVSENGKQVGVNNNGWDFANSAYTWNIENIEEPTRILMNGQQKGIGVDSKTNNAPAFTDKHSGNAKNDYGATCYTWLFEAVDVPSEVYYTITNHQYDNKTHAFYVEGSQLKIGDANVPATEFGDEALFIKEDKGNNKWAFKNKASGEYLVFRGNGAGTNSDKGVVSAYNATYCDFTLTPNSRVENGFIITGKRNDTSKEGTYVVKTGGTFDAWSGATECWNGNYSNIFAIEEVIVGGSEPDVLFTTDAEATANEYRWVRITNARDAYSVYASTDAKLHSQPTDFTNEGELFALVGTEDNFKLYSRTVKAYFGYSATGGGSEVTKGATTQTFKLIDNTTNSVKGLNIVPTGNESQSFNMHGGKGNDIKFYGVGDGGSTWKITLVNKEEKGGIRLVGTPTSALNKLIGKLSVSVGAASGETLLTTENIAGRDNVTYYVNAKNHLAITPGYTFRGYKATVDGMNVTYTVDEDNKAQYLFYSTGAAHPYRIPAITRTPSGRLIALSDYRTCGSDIGYGRVDIVGRYSDDNGQTWSNEYMVLEGDGDNNSNTCGYGDAALVTDWKTGEVMLMCVSAPNGGTCWTARQRGVVSVSSDNGLTWSKPVDIKDKICNTSTSLLPGVRNYFVGSGKLHQSRYIKVGTHYRVYAALWTTPDGSSCDNHVIYTDDFGKTWKLLGTTTTCVDGGNEPKCEELPDGSVLISSRKGYGRYYNVFTYDKANNDDYSKGSWGSRVEGCNSNDSSTNGEILITKATKADGSLVTIAIQSMPNNGRSNVSFWYKELNGETGHKFNSSEFSGQWTKGLEVSKISSAYSTMCMQDDGRIAFFFEEGPAGYEMVYMPLTISEVTNNTYCTLPWSVGHVTKAVKMGEDGTCTVREIDELSRYILHQAE